MPSDILKIGFDQDVRTNPFSYDVKVYGAKGDGVTDDTAAISTAMDAANGAGAQLYFSPGTYRCGTITKSYALVINGTPGTVTILATNTSSWTWNFQGSLGSTVSLTSNVNQFSSVVNASTTGLTAGDLILLADNQVPYSGQSTRTQGQIVEIESIVSGGQLTLIEQAYSSFLTAQSGFIAKVTAPSGLRISGLQFKNTDSTSLGGFIRCTYLRNLNINIEGEGSGAGGIRLEHCHDFKITTRARNYFDQALTSLSQFGYGAECVGACANGDVYVKAQRVRHAFTCGGIDSTHGEPLNIKVSGIADGCSAQSWDAHAQGRNIVFENCQSYGPRSYHFSLRGKNQHIVGGVGYGGYGGVWLFEGPSDNKIDAKFYGIQATDSRDTSGVGGHEVYCQVPAPGLQIITNADKARFWRPSGTIATTIPNERIAALASGSTQSTGRLTVAGGMILPPGISVNTLTFWSGGTGGATLTHMWAALLDQSLNILRKSNDDTSATWAINSPKSFTLASIYTPTEDIPVFVGLVVVGTTMPTLIQLGISSVETGRTPMLAATANSSLTDPASLTSVSALTALANQLYCEAS